MRTRHLLPIVMALALLASGLAQGMHHGGMHGGGMHGGPMPGHAMDMPESELEFLQHMIVHHREAVESAERLLERTERAELQAFLEDVIEAQTAEIELMTGWIESRYPDAEVDVPYEPMMRDLEDAPVAEQEQAFLEDMIVHHMGAVRDAQALLSRGLAEEEEVADLARSIVNEQRREIEQMRDWLIAWFDVDAMRMPGMMDREPPGDAQDDDAAGVDAHHQGPMGMGMHGMHGMQPEADRHGMGMHGMGMHGMGMHGMGMHGMGMHGMGMHGMGMHGMGMRGMGMHGMGMRGMGMRGMPGMMACPGPMGMGMHGMQPSAGMPGMMGGMRGMGMGMHDEVGFPPMLEALARAFLAGEGIDVDAVDVDDVRLTYEVVVRHEGVERVLIIDAETGRVREATER